MKREERILNYMREFGSITTIEAFTYCGTTELRKIVSDLKKKGYAIESERVTGINKFGENVSFNKYWLKERA